MRSKVWYGPALFLMPAVLFVSWACMTLLDYPLPEPDLHASMIPVLFAVFLVAAAGEEAGWMPFVVDPLQERYGAWAAGAICGAVWAIWHVIPWAQAGHGAAWIAWHSLVTVLLRIVIVWIYNHAGRSVWMAALTHAGANTAFFLFPDYGSHYDPMTAGIVLAIFVVFAVRPWRKGL